jgi:hypothetical protein
MVLTERVGAVSDGFTRRVVLGGATGVTGAAVLAGCGLFGKDKEQQKAADQLQPVLNEALALAAAYDQAVVSQPGLSKRLTPLAADHRQHAAALAKAIGADLPSPGASASAGAASASDAAGTVAALRKAEQTAQKNAAAACRTTAADRAGLVGSIAACRAAHAEALR